MTRAFAQRGVRRRRDRGGGGGARRRPRVRALDARARARRRLRASQSCSCRSPTSAPQAWRIAFAISALTIFLLPRLARSLRETGRYIDLAEGRLGASRGRVREVFDRRVRLSVPAPRPRSVPHELLQRAVGAADQPVPHRRARVLEHPDRGFPRRHRRDSRPVRASSSPASSPRPAAAGRSRSSDWSWRPSSR